MIYRSRNFLFLPYISAVSHNLLQQTEFHGIEIQSAEETAEIYGKKKIISWDVNHLLVSNELRNWITTFKHSHVIAALVTIVMLPFPGVSLPEMSPSLLCRLWRVHPRVTSLVSWLCIFPGNAACGVMTTACLEA